MFNFFNPVAEQSEIFLFFHEDMGRVALTYSSWVRGLMAINVECEFRDRGSIPSVCQITDADLGKVG